MAQRRTFFRSNYWAPVIARERSIVLAIAWYIGVELLRTKQLPQYITYTGIGRVPCLRADIQKQAARVYTNLFRKDDIVNKFYVADTGENHLDGKVGVITSYYCAGSLLLDQTFIKSIGGGDNLLLYLSICTIEWRSKRTTSFNHV